MILINGVARTLKNTRLLDQAMILFNYVSFQMGTSLKGKNTHYIILLLEMYGYIKMQNYELFNKKISDFDWSCLHQGTVNEASSLFTNILLSLLNCIVKLL